MSFPIRVITPDDFPGYVRTDNIAFGSRMSSSEIERTKSELEFDRSLGAFDGNEVVGTAAAISFEITLPGNVAVPAAGVTWVSVMPTHRRRGILTSMMRRQLQDIRERGEHLAILLASESLIYGRYGYGAATIGVDYELETRYGTFRGPVPAAGRMRVLEPDEALAVIPQVYERVRLGRPGTLSRSESRWQNELDIHNQPWEKAKARFHVAYADEAEDTQGYVSYRMQQRWQHGLADYILTIDELIATSPEAYAALWAYCIDADLVRLIRAGSRPQDEPLRWMLAEPRRFRTTNSSDFLWVRIVDVIGALSARRYTNEGRVVLAISDPFVPDNSGTYELVTTGNGSTCRRVDRDPDLEMDIADLGSIYLGGVHCTTLAFVGRIREHTPGALKLADALFLSDPQPWCNTEF